MKQAPAASSILSGPAIRIRRERASAASFRTPVRVPTRPASPRSSDPTPAKPRGNGDEVALIPDGASPSSDVVRARWEPGSGRPGSGHFEFLDTVTMVQADLVDKGSRPMATTLGPDGNVYVTFQRENTIQRIVDPRRRRAACA